MMQNVSERKTSNGIQCSSHSNTFLAIIHKRSWPLSEQGTIFWGRRERERFTQREYYQCWCRTPKCKFKWLTYENHLDNISLFISLVVRLFFSYLFALSLSPLSAFALSLFFSLSVCFHQIDCSSSIDHFIVNAQNQFETCRKNTLSTSSLKMC